MEAGFTIYRCSESVSLMHTIIKIDKAGKVEMLREVALRLNRVLDTVNFNRQTDAVRLVEYKNEGEKISLKYEVERDVSGPQKNMVKSKFPVTGVRRRVTGK